MAVIGLSLDAVAVLIKNFDDKKDKKEAGFGRGLDHVAALLCFCGIIGTIAPIMGDCIAPPIGVALRARFGRQPLAGDVSPW